MVSPARRRQVLPIPAAGADGPNSRSGFLLPMFAFAEQAWSAPFFVFAAAGLFSIGAMGWTGTGRCRPAIAIARDGEDLD